MPEKNLLETYLENNTDKVLLTTETQEASVILAHQNQQIIDLEQYLPAPRRIKENKVFYDLRGLIDYTNDYATDQSRAFISDDKILVVFDYHEKESPHHCNHRAQFNLNQSERWRLWHSINNQWIEQKKFADFLDSGLNEIVNPQQDVILEMVKNFRAMTSYEFDNQTTPYGGEKLSFTKITKTGTSVKGEVEIPTEMIIQLETFEKVSYINDRLSKLDIEKPLAKVTDAEGKETVPTRVIPAYSFRVLLKWFYDENVNKVFFKIQILNIETAFDKTLQKIVAAFQELAQVKSYIS